METSHQQHGKRVHTFDALSSPAYRRLWLGTWLWYVPRMMELVVLSWLVLEVTDSPFMVSLVGFSRMLPMFLFGLAAGSLADRFPKKRIMLAAQILTFGTYLAMTGLLFMDTFKSWHAFPAIFLTGTSFAIDFSARRAFFSEILDKSRVINAVSLDTVALTGSQLLGALIGGFLVNLLNFEGTYTIMLVSVTGALVLMATVKSPGTGRAVSAPLKISRNLAEAFHIAKENTTVWAVLLVTVAFNLFVSPFMQMVPVIARDVLGADSTRYGILAAALGIGSVTGSLVIATINPTKQGNIMTLGAAFMAMGVLLFATSETYVLSFAFLFVSGIALSGFVTMQIALVLNASPPDLRGRAVGALTLGMGATPLGILLLGQLAEYFGPQVALRWLCGFGLAALLILWWRYPVLRDAVSGACGKYRNSR